MPKFKDFVDKVKDGEFVYDTMGGGKFKTNVPLNKRSFDNLPKYSNGRSRVKFQDWLHIKPQGSKKMPNGMRTPNTYGKSDADGKWYGWSHRAVYGFGVGDEVKGDSLGKKSETDPDFVIKTDDQAMKVAMTFADNVS